MVLPIENILPDLKMALAEKSTAVLVAPPGAGKSTGVPLALLREPWLAGQKILLLQPRRLAAVSIADYLARQLGEDVGHTVGYAIRFERLIRKTTRIEVVTEGILCRRLQADPELTGVGLIIFDEFHERNLQADLGLALARDSQESLRPDLRLLLMSATLDGAAVSGALPGASLIQAAGRSYPVQVAYRPSSGRQALPQQLAAVLADALQRAGDVLIFLPGVAEIESCRRFLHDHPCAQGATILALHGGLPVERQRRVVAPGRTRKVILATNIAETSLTIDGIATVIDSGLERRARYAPESGLSHLETRRISKASAEQRTGRAGRQGPGFCYRLWAEADQQGLIQAAPPEIRQADLCRLALELIAWGVQDGTTLLWLDPPPSRALAAAQNLLRLLGAVCSQNRLTSLGRTLLQWPLHPRLGRLLVAARDSQCLALGCDLVALLELRASAAAGHSDSESDLLPLLQDLWCPTGTKQFYPARRLARFWRHYFNLPNGPVQADINLIGQLSAAAFPDRIGRRRRGREGHYLLSGGRGVILGKESGLQRPEALVALDLLSRDGEVSRIRCASVYQLEHLSVQFPDLVSWQRRVHWDRQAQGLRSREVLGFGALELKERGLTASTEERISAVCCGIRSEGLALLNWSRATLQFQSRWRLMVQIDSDGCWPDLSDAWLHEHLEQWLGPFIGKISNRDQLRKFEPLKALQALFDYRQLRRLETDLPMQYRLPSGRRVHLDYCLGDSPVLAVKLQELFGMRETPTLAGGRLVVTLHLLSPARRPIQMTRDLSGFWEKTYPEVRRELAGRYPKHSWPEDPMQALPAAK